MTPPVAGRPRRPRAAAPAALLACLLLAPAAPAAAEVVDTIAAVVGGEIVLLSDVVKIAEIVKTRARVQLGQEVPDEEAMQMAAMELVDNLLIRQAAADLRVEVTTGEVDQALQNQIGEQGISKEKFVAFLAGQGMDEQTYREFVLKSQLLRYKVVGLKAGGPKVSEEDAKKFYDQQTLAIMKKATYKLAHILIAIPGGADVVEVAKLREKAQTVAKEARLPGADFAALVDEFSDDEDTIETGGVMGKFKHSQLAPAIRKAVVLLDEGEVSDPVKTAAGFEIVKVLKKKSPAVKPFDEVKGEIMDDLVQAELNRQMEILLKELRRNTYIDIK